MRQSKTHQELFESSEHLHYELHTMRDTAKLLLDSAAYLNGPTSLPILEVIRNALLESFLVHTRSLLHFLYAKDLRSPVKPDDFVAQDFVQSFAVPCPPELAQVYERINKEIAHLTAERSKRKDKQWEFFKIANQVEDEVAAFLQQVPDNKLEPGILAYKKSRTVPQMAQAS